MVRASRVTFAFLSFAVALAVISTLRSRVSCFAALVARVDSLRGLSTSMLPGRSTRIGLTAVAKVEVATDLEVA